MGTPRHRGAAGNVPGTGAARGGEGRTRKDTASVDASFAKRAASKE